MHDRTRIKSHLKRGASGAALVLSAWFAPNPAAALIWPRETTPPTVSVYQLGRPDYAAPGVDVGGFKLSPSLSDAAEYDGNIFASDTHRQDDFVNETTETLAAASQWSRHSLMATIYSTQQIFKNHPEEDANTYSAEVTGRLDIPDEGFFQLSGAFIQQPQQRAALEASTNTGSRPIFNEWTSTLDFNQPIGRWTERAQIDVRQTAYVSSRDASRSNLRPTFANRISYDVSDQFGLFVQGTYAQQNWLLRRDLRNFDTLTGLIGVSVEIPTIISAELGIGVLRQHYKNDSFDELVTPTASANVIWNVLPLTSVVGSINYDVTGTETFCDLRVGLCQSALSPGSSSTLHGNESNTLESFTAQVGFQHEFLQDLLGQVKFRYERDTFDFNNLIDDVYALTANARYLINPYAELDLDFTHTTRTANLPLDRTYNSGPYTENIIALTFKVGL